MMSRDNQVTLMGLIRKLKVLVATMIVLRQVGSSVYCIGNTYPDDAWEWSRCLLLEAHSVLTDLLGRVGWDISK